MSMSNAKATWEGGLREGHGSMAPAHGSAIPFSLATRFEGKEGGNPEELIGAALAGCFSMALAADLGKAGMSPKIVQTEAKVRLDKDGSGFKIAQISLVTTANVPGIDGAKLKTIAEATKASCPVAKALAGTTITLEVRLG